MRPLVGVIAQIVGALVIADLFGAVGHWAEDNYLPYSTETPILKSIARGNELHHFAPHTITHESYFDTCKVMIVLTIIYILFCRFILQIKVSNAPAFYMTSALIGPIINLIHRWQHEKDERRPRLVSLLQRMRILVPPDVHRRHHKDDLSYRDYGLILNPMNALYNMGLWSTLEHLVRASTGVEPCPKRGVDAYPERFNNESDDDYETRLERMFARGELMCRMRKYG